MHSSSASSPRGRGSPTKKSGGGAAGERGSNNDQFAKYATELAANRTSPSYSQTMQLMSQMAEQDLYDSLRPFLVAENLISQSQGETHLVTIREDILKSLARKWNLHKEPGFWRVHNTKLKLAQTLAEYGKRHHHIILGHQYSQEHVGEKEEMGFQPSKPKIETVQLPQVRNSESSSESAVNARGVAALKQGLNPYSGDKFSSRGNYDSSVVYLSRYAPPKRESMKRDSKGNIDPQRIRNRRLSSFVEMFNKPLNEEEDDLGFLDDEQNNLNELLDKEDPMESKRKMAQTPVADNVFFGEDESGSTTTGVGEDPVGRNTTGQSDHSASQIRKVLNTKYFGSASLYEDTETQHHSDLRKQCALAVRDISKNPNARVALWKEGTLHSLRKMLSSHKREKDIKAICIEALSNLTGISPQGRPSSGEGNISPEEETVVYLEQSSIVKVGDLTKTALAGPTDPISRTQLMATLYNLSCYRELHSQMLFEGAISIILQLLPPILERYAKIGVQLSHDMQQFECLNDEVSPNDIHMDHLSKVAHADSLCMALGLKAFCNFAGAEHGSSQLLRNGAVSFMCALWDWFSYEQRLAAAGHLAFNVVRFCDSPIRAVDEGAVQMMIDACADGLRLKDKHCYFVLCRTVLAVSWLSQRKNVLSTLAKEELLTVVSAAALMIGSDTMTSSSWEGCKKNSGGLSDRVDKFYDYSEGINVIADRQQEHFAPSPLLMPAVLRRFSLAAICRLSWDPNNHTTVSGVKSVRVLLASTLCGNDGPTRKICTTALCNLLSTEECAHYWCEKRFVMAIIHALQLENCYERPFICQAFYNATTLKSVQEFFQRMAKKDKETSEMLVSSLIHCLQESLRHVENGDPSGASSEGEMGAHHTLYSLADGARAPIAQPEQHMTLSYCLSIIRNLSTVSYLVDYLCADGSLVRLLERLAGGYGESGRLEVPVVSLNCLYDVIAVVSNAAGNAEGRAALLKSSILASLVPVATGTKDNIVARTRKGDEAGVKQQFVQNVKYAMRTAEAALETFESSSSVKSRSSGRNLPRASSRAANELKDPEARLEHPLLTQALNCEILNKETKKAMGQLKDREDEAKKQCAIAISSLSASVESASGSTSGDVITALVALCDFHDSDGSVKVRVTTALNSLVADPQYVQALVDSGAIPKVVDLCGSNVADVRRNCVHILSRLSAEPTLAKCIVEEGAVKAMLVAALVRGADIATERLCALTLYNLLGEIELRYRVLNDGVSWALRKLSDSSDVATKRIAALTMYRLSMDPQAQSTLVVEGGLKCVIKSLALSSPNAEGERLSYSSSSSRDKGGASSSDQVLQQLFASTLTTVSTRRGNEAALLQEGAIEPLVQLLKAEEKQASSGELAADFRSFFVEPNPSNHEDSLANPNEDFSIVAARGIFTLSSTSNQALRSKVVDSAVPRAVAQVANDESQTEEVRLCCIATVTALLWQNYTNTRLVRDHGIMRVFVKVGSAATDLKAQHAIATALHYISCRHDFSSHITADVLRDIGNWMSELCSMESPESMELILGTLSLCLATAINAVTGEGGENALIEVINDGFISNTIESVQNLFSRLYTPDTADPQIVFLVDLLSTLQFQVCKLLLYEDCGDSIDESEIPDKLLSCLRTFIIRGIQALTPLALVRLLFSLRILLAYSLVVPQLWSDQYTEDLKILINILISLCQRLGTTHLGVDESALEDTDSVAAHVCENFEQNEECKSLAYEAFCHAARCLCNLAGNSSTRSAILESKAADAFIVASELNDVDSSLRYACLRALCQLAIDTEDPDGIRLPTKAQSMLEYSDAGGSVHNGAVSALIAVMGADERGSSSLSIDTGSDKLQENFRPQTHLSATTDSAAQDDQNEEREALALDTSVCSRHSSRISSLPNTILYHQWKGDHIHESSMSALLMSFYEYEETIVESFSSSGEVPAENTDLLSDELLQNPPPYVFETLVPPTGQKHTNDEATRWGRLNMEAIQSRCDSGDSENAEHVSVSDIVTIEAPHNLRTTCSKPSRGYRYRKTQYLSASVASAVLRSYEINGNDRKAAQEEAIVASLATIGIDVGSTRNSSSRPLEDSNQEDSKPETLDSRVEVKQDGIGISDFEYSEPIYVEQFGDGIHTTETKGEEDSGIWEQPFQTCVEPVVITQGFERHFAGLKVEDLSKFSDEYSQAARRFQEEHPDGEAINVHAKACVQEEQRQPLNSSTADFLSSLALIVHTARNCTTTNLGLLQRGSSIQVGTEQGDYSVLQHPDREDTTEASPGKTAESSDNETMQSERNVVSMSLSAASTTEKSTHGTSEGAVAPEKPSKESPQVKNTSKKSPNVRKRKTVSIKEKKRPGPEEAAVDTVQSQRKRIEAQTRRKAAERSKKK
eukprot:gb/GECG01012089.1/.p1 GENE.gb/GECG01012089.1/~~gb/GECG01012089.1/.p1  ORF type:complete len:2372 (+),score=318.44 gb/GECG01012089.1/:1-7116(+)